MRQTPHQLPLFPPDWPPGLGYLPDYITPDAARHLAQQIDAQPWRDDLQRRVQHYGYRYDYKARQARRSDALGPLPSFLASLAACLAEQGHFARPPDQVIVNEYLPGQGIAAHIDCQPCFGEVIAGISLLSPCIMRFQHAASGQIADLWLDPGSLLILSGPARHDWRHSIPARRSDRWGGQSYPRHRRLSLTFREMRLS